MIWWIPWKICTSRIWTSNIRKLHETSPQINRNIIKKHFGLFAINLVGNERDKSGTWRYPRHAPWRILQAFSLTGALVFPSDLVKFFSRKEKNDIIFKKKGLNGNINDLKKVGFTSGKWFISDLMCYENHQLWYRCTELKRQRLLYSAWFFRNCIYIKVDKNSNTTRIKHVCDIEKALNMEKIDSYLEINV